MMKDSQKKYFQEAYDDKYNIWTTIPIGKEAEEFLRLVKKSKPTGKIIDVGCGNGKFATFFAKNGFEGYGIDYIPSAITQAKALAKKEGVKDKTHFKVGDVLNMDYPLNLFDVAYDYGCLHHMPKTDWKLYLKNLLNILKEDGFFMLTVFSINTENHLGFIPKKAKQNWHYHKKPGNFRHYDHFFTKQEIVDLLSKDFEIIKITEEKVNFDKAFKKNKPSERMKELKPITLPTLFHVQMRRK